MKTILLTNTYKGRPLEIVNSTVPKGFRLLMLDELSQSALMAAAPEADYILASGRLKIDETVLTHASQLKMIQRTGVGLDSLDLEAISQREIPLYVNQGVNANSVAEHTLLLILACLRKLPEINTNTKGGIWRKQEQGTQTRELRGKTVGLIGMGNIAKRLVELLDAFEVDIIYNSRTRLNAEYEKLHSMRYAEKDEVFRRADIISLHCPLNDETRNLINANTIDMMKDGVILVNTARGPIVNANDLADALKRGKVGYAGIDVHEEEPLTEGYPLKQIKNVILTPHIGGITYESFYSMMHGGMRNIALFDRGEFERIAPYRRI